MNGTLFLYSIVLLGVAFAGGLVALAKQWSDRLLHAFVSFGAGVFLGAVFFELLPEAMTQVDNRAVGVAVLAGYLLIFFIERILLASGEGGYDHNHKVISMAVFFGLSVHSLIDGLGLAVGVRDARLGQIVFASILSHHIPAAFSLTSLLILARFPTRKVVTLLLLFSATPPLGAFLIQPLLSSASDQLFVYLIGLMSGTFLYVATGDLLPEVFHSKIGRWKNLLLLGVGLALMAAISFGFEHVHEH